MPDEDGERALDGPIRGLPATVAGEIVDALADGVIVVDADGIVLHANPAIESLLGWAAGDLLGTPITDLVPQRWRDGHPRAVAALAAGEAGRLSGRPIRLPVRTKAGQETHVEVALSDLLADEGRFAVVTVRAAHRRSDRRPPGELVERLLAALASERDELAGHTCELVGEALGWDGAALWELGPSRRSLKVGQFWQRPGTESGGLPAFMALSTTMSCALGEDLPGRAYRSRLPVAASDLATFVGSPRLAAARAFGLATALSVPLLAGASVLGVLELYSLHYRAIDPPLEATMAAMGRHLGELLARAEAEQDGARLLVELRAAQSEQARLLHAQDFLLHAGRALAEAADYAEALDRLARVAVPLLGDLCLIDVVDEDGQLTRMVARHANPTMQPIADELRERFPPDPAGPHPSIDVMHWRRSRWSPDMPDDFLRATTRDEQHFEIVKRLGFTSYMSVPLLAGERVVGSLTLVSAGSGRRFQESDLALAEELAGQAAAVIDRARRFDRAREAAHELQRSLLPEELPRLAGVEIAARYLPGTEGAEVGGDWYDVVPLGHADVGMAIGDVAGHDMAAAAVMGQLRNAMRAYAVQDGRPDVVIQSLRRLCEVLAIERMTTTAYARLCTSSGALTVASAGHLAPLIARRDGPVELLSLRPGPPLGLASEPPVTVETRLEPGDTVVLYTDGLVETRHADLGQGLAWLMEAAARSGDTSPDVLCESVTERLHASNERGDDVAVLALRYLGR